jgi:hypothetical protein
VICNHNLKISFLTCYEGCEAGDWSKPALLSVQRLAGGGSRSHGTSQPGRQVRYPGMAAKKLKLLFFLYNGWLEEGEDLLGGGSSSVSGSGSFYHQAKK